jgi:uncharacterized protein (DUF983 family)
MSRLSSIFQMTCPRCHQGKMFESLEIRHPLKMNKVCTVCGQKFEPEPGFYYGAMFISYIFIGFFSLGFVGLCVFYFHLSVDLAFGILLVCLALMFLWNLRFSRSLWIHLVIRYDPKSGKNQTSR